MVARNRVSSGFKRFVDFKRIQVRGGNGGDGAIAFFNTSSMGPPCGGNGGKGGSVYIRATKEITDLSSLEKKYHARNGTSGSFNQKHGANGGDLILNVPLGTRIKKIINQNPLDDGGLDDLEIVQKYFKFANSYVPKEDRIKMLLEIKSLGKSAANNQKPLELDLVEEGQSVLLVSGGSGGLGNPHFVTPKIPGPQIAGRGEIGQSTQLEIELKVIADAGLVGLPNAGKSSLLAAVSAAHPKIASYAFTTMHPYIGTIDYPDFFSITLADIPGLIKGAAKNIGLGHRFLRHIERSKILVYVIDLNAIDPLSDFQTLQEELEEYRPGLSNKPTIIVGNKSDLPTAFENYQKLVKLVDWPVVPVSAKEKKNITVLTDTIRKTLSDISV